MRRVDLIVWGVLFVFGGFVIHESLGHSYYGSDFGPGPGFFSFWLGILLILLSLGRIVSAFRQPSSEPLPDGFFPGRAGIRRMLFIIGALAAALLLMKYLGFSLTMLGFAIVLFRALGSQSWWLTMLLAVLGSFGLSFLFGLLQVAMPTGFLGI